MTLSQRAFSSGMLFGSIVMAMLAGCAPEKTAVTTRDIEAKAEPIIKQMCTTLDGAKALRFRVDATMDKQVGTGQLAQFHRTSEVTMVRPDRFFAKTDSDEGRHSVWYRGKTLTILDVEANVYATETVPGRMGEMLDYMADKHDIVMPMADLLVGKTYDSMLAEVESGEYVGLHEVNGTPCHHLLFHQDNLDWQIWIDSGKQPLPRKLVITHTRQTDQPQYIAVIDGWDLSPSTSDEMFTFTPPAGAGSVTMAELVKAE